MKLSSTRSSSRTRENADIRGFYLRRYAINHLFVLSAVKGYVKPEYRSSPKEMATLVDGTHVLKFSTFFSPNTVQLVNRIGLTALLLPP